MWIEGTASRRRGYKAIHFISIGAGKCFECGEETRTLYEGRDMADKPITVVLCGRCAQW